MSGAPERSTDDVYERGDRVALKWRVPNVAGRRAVLFVRSADHHRLIADHICSEYRIRPKGAGERR